jgi:hypothetical protein
MGNRRMARPEKGSTSGIEARCITLIIRLMTRPRFLTIIMRRRMTHADDKRVEIV